MAKPVVFAPEAESDLAELYEYIAQRSNPERALAYTDRIVAACLGLARFPERGTRRDDVRPGLWVIGFRRRVTIAFRSGADTVIIIRVLSWERDLGMASD